MNVTSKISSDAGSTNRAWCVNQPFLFSHCSPVTLGGRIAGIRRIDELKNKQSLRNAALKKLHWNQYRTNQSWSLIMSKGSYCGSRFLFFLSSGVKEIIQYFFGSSVSILLFSDDVTGLYGCLCRIRLSIYHNGLNNFYMACSVADIEYRCVKLWSWRSGVHEFCASPSFPWI